MRCKQPADGLIQLAATEPMACDLSNDYLVVETAAGMIKVVLVDAYHVLISKFSAAAVEIVQRSQLDGPMRCRLQVARADCWCRSLDHRFLDADVDAVIAERQSWLQQVTQMMPGQRQYGDSDVEAWACARKAFLPSAGRRLIAATPRLLSDSAFAGLLDIWTPILLMNYYKRCLPTKRPMGWFRFVPTPAVWRRVLIRSHQRSLWPCGVCSKLTHGLMWWHSWCPSWNAI